MTEEIRKLAAALYVTRERLPALIDSADKGLDLFDTEEDVVGEIVRMLRGTHLDPDTLSCLAARALVETAKAQRELAGRLTEARRHPLDLGGRRHLTREVVEDIAHEVALDQREEALDG